MSEASLLLSLPDDVLKLVMQHVPPHDRLQHACLVNRRLHAAAVAATQEVSVSKPSQAAAAIEWLAHYGQHVTYLFVRSGTHLLQELPCPNLLDLLVFSNTSLQLGPAAAGGPPGVLHACTALTKLSVRCSTLQDPKGVALEALSCLVGLQHLHLWPEVPLTHGLSAATLPRLSHLTSLFVQGLSLENLGQLSALSSLKQLAFSAGDVAVGPGSVPGLAFSAALTSLHLWSPVEAEVFSLLPTGLLKLHIYYDVVGPAGLFLSGIARLQQLTELTLDPSSPLDWPPAGPAYSALTASSSLATMWLQGGSVLAASLPEGVWPFVFPAGRSLPHLTELILCDEDDGVPTDPARWGPSWGPADVASLVRCCPQLPFIGTMYMQHGRHVSELQKLPALWLLHVVYGPADLPGEFAWSMRHLGAVTQLQYLRVEMAGGPVDATALLPLTQLKGLTELQYSPLGGDPGSKLELRNTQVAGAAPDVYIQLLEHCAKAAAESNPYTAAAAEAVASLARMSAQQRRAAADSHSLLIQQAQQLATQQQQMALLQQQVLYQQQQLMDQWQQLLNQQWVIGAQQQQISALLQSQPQLHSQMQAPPGQAAAEQGDLAAGLQEQLQQQSLL